MIKLSNGKQDKRPANISKEFCPKTYSAGRLFNQKSTVGTPGTGQGSAGRICSYCFPVPQTPRTTSAHTLRSVTVDAVFDDTIICHDKPIVGKKKKNSRKTSEHRGSDTAGTLSRWPYSLEPSFQSRRERRVPVGYPAGRMTSLKVHIT